MRLWSIHPNYLDTRGLCGLWREGIMARNALLGKGHGYRNHPQLLRFKKQDNPLIFIDTYLLCVYNESIKRNYHFNRDLFGFNFTDLKIDVTDGQVLYEFKHLKRKLKTRDFEKYSKLKEIKFPEVNPVFKVVIGDIESWEKPY